MLKLAFHKIPKSFFFRDSDERPKPGRAPDRALLGPNLELVLCRTQLGRWSEVQWQPERSFNENVSHRNVRSNRGDYPVRAS
jgi:hypothetical protein